MGARTAVHIDCIYNVHINSSDGSDTWEDTDFPFNTLVTYDGVQYVSLVDIPSGSGNPQVNAAWGIVVH